MKKYPILYFLIGLIFLIVPTIIYLYFLIPHMKEEYISLMSSGGIITSGGLYASNMIPEKMKMSKLLKLSSKSFTLLVGITLVQEFLPQILGLLAVIVASFIIFLFFKELYLNAKRRNENAELAREVARSVAENIK